MRAYGWFMCGEMAVRELNNFTDRANGIGKRNTMPHAHGKLEFLFSIWGVGLLALWLCTSKKKSVLWYNYSIVSL